MPLYTPRGLKLWLSKSYVFALMARLHGKETAFRVLQLTEEVENLGRRPVGIHLKGLGEGP